MQEYANSVIGKSIDTDGYPPAQVYQCVDLAKHYMLTVYGVPYAAYGNAVDYWTNTDPAILAKFDPVSYPCDIKDGDVIVWGAGDETSKLGHIAVAYNGQMINQNNAGRNYVTVDNIFTSGLLGVLRPKENNTMTEIQIIELYRFYLGAKKPAQSVIDYWKPYTYEQLRNAILNGQEYKDVISRVKAGTESIINHCPDDMVNNYKAPTCPTNCPEYIKLSDIYIKK